MDKWQIQYRFWSSFGVPAYEENSVPEGAPYPYITYEAVGGGWDAVSTVTASIWDRNRSSEFVDKLSDQMEKYIDVMNPLDYEDGKMAVWIGNTTFSQTMGDPSDDMVKRKILHVQIEFMAIWNRGIKNKL